MFLKTIQFKTSEEDTYPFLPFIKNIGELTFCKNVTIICGDNASGKTTLLKLIAKKMDCYSIEEGSKTFNADLKKMHAEKVSISNNRFIFTSEDFINYINNLEKMKQFAKDNLAEIEANKTMSLAAKHFAKMPYGSTLYEINKLYQKNLSTTSHGEGYLEFFLSRLRENGFYVLDEPEAALSYENQYRLAYKINELASNHNCQFIIATHSPILTAIPNAQILQIEENYLKEVKYADIENINFLKLFLNRNGNGFFK